MRKHGVSNQDINAYLDNLLQAKKTRLEAAAASTNKKSWARSILTSLIRGTVPNKPTLSLADLPPLQPTFDCLEIQKKMDQIFREMIDNQAKHANLLKSASCTYGLYDHIIKQLVKRDTLMLMGLEVIYGVLLAAFFIFFTGFFSSILNFTKLNLTEFFVTLGSTIIILILVAIVRMYLTHKESSIRMVIYQALKLLIFKKLEVSDQYFLDSADNNLIYKLMYSEFDDYVSYIPSFCSIVPLVSTLAVYLSAAALLGGALTLTSILWPIQLLITIVLELAKRNQQIGIKKASFEQRKVVYEFVYNFKGFTLNNLYQRYFTLSRKFLEEKAGHIKKFQSCNALQKLLNRTCLKLMLFIGPAVFYFCGHKYEHNQKLIEYFAANYFAYVIFTIGMEPIAERFVTQISKLLNRQCAMLIFDRFFNNDYIVDDAIINTEEVMPGEILVKECEILERDKYSINQTLNYILNKGIGSEAKSKAYMTTNYDEKIFLQPQNPNPNPSPSGSPLLRARTIANKKLDSLVRGFKSFAFPADLTGGEVVSKLRIVCTGLNVHIPPGSKVCIFENDNTRIIRGFIDMLLKRNFVSSGEIRMVSAISYFNPKRMHFLVGKTIRDNIIFGQIFNIQRYDDVLKFLGVQFGNYRGQDLCEVAENGNNIKTEDQISIMMARFLYQDSDVYIIEEYFRDFSINLGIDQAKKMLKTILAKKTVLFVANVKELIKFTDQIIIFKNDRSHFVVNSQDYMSQLEKHRKDSIQSNEESGTPTDRMQNTGFKYKNSVFIANVSFEEELVIYKKLEKRRAELDQMRMKDMNQFEIIVYGIFLTQQKREQGRAIEDKPVVPDDKIRELTKEFLGKKHVRLYIVSVVLLHLIPRILYFWAEFEVFYYFFVTDELNRESIEAGFIWIIGLMIPAFVINTVKLAIISKIYAYMYHMFNTTVESAILNSDIRNVLNKKSHRILDMINQNLLEMETCVPTMVNTVLNVSVDVIVSMLALSFTLSLWPILIGIISHLLRRYIIMPTCQLDSKLSYIHRSIKRKIDDLNFQLLSIIGNYRVSNKLDVLRENYHRLLNNQAKVKSAILSSSTRIYCLGDANAALMGLLFFTLIILMDRYRILNWFETKALLAWSSLATIRLVYCMSKVPGILVEFNEQRNNIASFFLFVRQQRRTKVVEKKEWQMTMTKKLDFECPIVFKNVSVTMGLQPILKKMSFKVPPRSRIGILGVDGGGRSILFELITGALERDSIEHSKISLFGLQLESIDESVIKKEIFVLERNPVLFEGTISENIDPYREKTDRELLTYLWLLRVETVFSKEIGDIAHHKPALMKTLVKPRMSMFEKINRQESPEGDRKSLFIPESEFIRSESRLQSFDQNDSPSKLIASHRLRYADAGSDVQIDPEDKQGARTIRVHDQSNLQQFFTKTPVHDPRNKGKNVTQYATPEKRRGNKVLNLGKIMKSKSEKSKQVPNLKEYTLPFDNMNETEDLKNVVMKPEPDADSQNKLLESQGSIKTLKKAPGQQYKTTPMLDSPRSIQFKSNDEVESRVIIERSRSPGGILQLPKHTPQEAGSSQDMSQLYSNSVQNQQLRLPEEPEGLKRLSTRTPSQIKREIDDIERIIIHVGKHKHTEQMDSGNLQQINNNMGEETPASPGRLGLVNVQYESMSSSSVEEPERMYTESVSEQTLLDFLITRASFGGKNIDRDVRKMVKCCRAIVAQPKILLMYEDSLEFGGGIDYNLKAISKLLPDSTIMVITKNNHHLVFYDKVIFIDAGQVLERGDPKVLLKNPESFVYRYLKETDKRCLEELERLVKELESVIKIEFEPELIKPDGGDLATPVEIPKQSRPNRNDPNNISSLTVRIKSFGQDEALGESTYKSIQDSGMKMIPIRSVDMLQEPPEDKNILKSVANARSLSLSKSPSREFVLEPVSSEISFNGANSTQRRFIPQFESQTMLSKLAKKPDTRRANHMNTISAEGHGSRMSIFLQKPSHNSLMIGAELRTIAEKSHDNSEFSEMHIFKSPVNSKAAFQPESSFRGPIYSVSNADNASKVSNIDPVL